VRLQTYGSVFANRDARRVLLLGLIVRIPIWAGATVLTLHVVTHLGRSYGAAGLVEAAATVAASISNPWRGRHLDRVGLRRTVAPSLVVLAACWAVAPFVSYWPLLVLVTVGGLFVVPQFSIVRQAIIHAVPDDDRKTALSLDSVLTELSFMIGPAAGVLLATYWPTSWALFTCEFVAVAGSLLIWLMNPTVRNEPDPAASTEKIAVREWLSPEVVGILAMSTAAVLVLSGTDVSVVAALRHMHHQSWIGWELAVWGLGSAVGGLVYGGTKRAVPLPLLLACLAVTTVPIVFSPDPFTLAGLLFVTGAFCAPTITAAVDALSRAVPDRVRGEALGWHGSAMTAGSALGTPLAGVAIDHFGWQGGFLVVGILGLVAAAGGSWAARGTHAGRRSVTLAPGAMPGHGDVAAEESISA
jgi:MFS family permease